MRGAAGRDRSIDFVKAAACILVALGHLFQGLSQAGILETSTLRQWFNDTIYTFHVPLFFICSGYLYQKTARFRGISGWGKNTVNKLVALGVPFIVYSAATNVLKLVFSSQVNNAGRDSFLSLFITPMSPYWFLYVLFFIFLITVPAKSDRHMGILLSVALAAKLFGVFFSGGALPYIPEHLIQFEIWFVLGMAVQRWDLTRFLNKRYTLFCSGVFLPLSVLLFSFGLLDSGWGFLVGLLACGFVFSLAGTLPLAEGEGLLRFAAKYNMPIFLMHTIFAAGTRSVLIALGIFSPGIHIVAGIAASFAFPVLAGWLFKKIKILNCTLSPPKIFR